ncbi:hypothetical protein AC578_4615 [Pseudocercospora eumusae]|uniref:Uncharacterized protein n=1 Tax=Pseudocercospora eumusae TaxID=321146 RepID=A0A139H4X8_9PEZI|nr:hypothetical protein AC578_4615 [Pseudocercospora eumusae]
MSKLPSSNTSTASTNRSRPKQHKVQNSDLSRVNLQWRHNKWTWTGTFLAQSFAIGIIVTAIVLGGVKKVAALKVRTIFGNEVDPDLQLALLGVFNKVLDLLVTKALTNFAGLLITMSMVAQGLHWSGVRLADFQLGEELTKPWESIEAFIQRGKTLGWRRAGWMRFTTTLIVSICVLLQGLAMNTLGYPKERWLTDPGPVQHPIPLFTGRGMDWSNFADQAHDLVGAGIISHSIANASIASQVLLAFDHFREHMLAEPTGWRLLDYVSDSMPQTAIDTRFEGPTSRGLAMQNQVVVDIFRYLHANGTANARAAKGWNGDLTLEVPSASASCDENNNTTVSGSLTVDTIPLDDELSTTFVVSIPRLSEQAFAGASCNVTFGRMRYPFGFWITSNAPTAFVVVDQYYTHFNASITPLPFQPVDNTIAKALSIQFASTVSHLETLNPNLLVSISHTLQTYRPEYNISDSVALAPVLAVLCNRLLSIAKWNVTYSSDHQIASSPIIWQLFGSGPRLKWEWIAVIILAVLLIAVTTSLGFSLVYRHVPGEWLRPGGMLVAANLSPEIETLRAAVEGAENEKEMAGMQLVVRSLPGRKRVMICDANIRPLTGPIEISKEYKWS